ncbi:uncharacterized protein PHALS_05039 [Plasmopara halstedii]|uniref:Uncharacterized protein n=1 Tax=Plasmopara halstedii TaxID=4781 RepID=A0A0P1AAI4_PLAHL|nr:uncharacterized protein PHALS_05039 [Plasmopara halstedii]CEG37446.1 hypothetical protein PHALS_05039 [Plasmopara halstedii]|eukprot:XP_024573815.1 hypothetical protein PHALS_05039 [Plasmopara halstedii]
MLYTSLCRRRNIAQLAFQGQEAPVELLTGKKTRGRVTDKASLHRACCPPAYILA